jgi:conjugative transfer signal peptidase TraF
MLRQAVQTAARDKRTGRTCAASSRRRVLAVAATVAGVLLAILSFHTARPSLVWNFSPSLPVGLYRIGQADWRVGDIVAIRPEKNLDPLYASGALARDRLLLKRILAAGGDMVCRTGETISTNGVSLATVVSEASSHLPAWRGCAELPDGFIFVMGDHPRSLDSRYFGPLSAGAVVGVIEPLLVASSPKGGVR